MFCKDCGQQIPDGDIAFCPSCGSPVHFAVQPSVPPQPPPQYQAPQQYQVPPPYPPPAQYQAPAYQGQPLPPQPPYQTQPPPRKKKHGCLIALLVVVLLLGAAVGAAALFVKGLFKPYDLGVEASEKVYTATIQKLGYTKDTAPVSGEIDDYQVIYGEPRPVDTTLSSEEITSFLTINRPPYYAIKNVQVRINPDNTVEASASLDVPFVLGQLLGGRYSKEDAQKELPMLGLIPDTVNLYSKFTGKIVNNEVGALDIEKISVMGITIPKSIYNRPEANRFIRDAINDNIRKVTEKQKSRVDLLEVQNGKLVFRGSIPGSISRKPFK